MFVCAHRVCVFVCHSAHVTVRGRVVLHFSPAFSCSRAAARLACPAPLPTELSCWPKLLIFFSFLFLCFYIWTNFPFLPRLPVPPCSLTPSTHPPPFLLKKGPACHGISACHDTSTSSSIQSSREKGSPEHKPFVFEMGLDWFWTSGLN